MSHRPLFVNITENGYSRILIVAGYRYELFERFKAEDVRIVVNPKYEFTASMGSLALCKDYIQEDFLLVEGIHSLKRKLSKFFLV